MKGAKHMKVAGFCPMGCGETLQFEPAGNVVCVDDDCPAPYAVHDLLQDRETEHVVSYSADGRWNAQHPLRERLNGALLDCPIHRSLAAALPREPGRYRVRVQRPSNDSSLPGADYRPGDAGLTFERIT